MGPQKSERGEGAFRSLFRHVGGGRIRRSHKSAGRSGAVIVSLHRLKLAFPLFIALLLSSCSEEGGSILETSIIRQCRANMNALCTDQASFADVNGRWASSLGELDESSGRLWPLECPDAHEEYDITISADSKDYFITCPAGHGSINTGTRSWCEESDR